MTSTKMAPFGLTQTFDGTALGDLDPAKLVADVQDNLVVVLRGLPEPSDDDMLALAGKLGDVLLWDFGAFNELRVDPNAANYLYTDRQVPLHWDGAFVGTIPRFIFFCCKTADADHGGETTFSNTVTAYQSLDEAHRERLDALSATYSTQKLAHYGGSFSSPLVQPHPVTGATTIRYAEPVADLNPVSVEVAGIPAEEQDRFHREMHELLYKPEFLYAHRWQQGDVVLADNHSLLHGRHALTAGANRHLRRLNIL